MYCHNCGTKLEGGTAFCSSCGANIDEIARGAGRSRIGTDGVSERRVCPAGLKLVSVLVAIFGLVSIAIGLSGLLEEWSLLLMPLGISEFIISWGLWTMKTWAWYAVMILFGISFVQNLVPPIEPSSIFAIFVFIIPILAYLYKQKNIYIGDIDK
ncbi:MAG: zinc ribbon domain-containing protein [Thermodesulfobacteriota bacterium]|nr:zinc ribbon domain-containing protein [Thermodesulfobacteriota bacterium]